LVFSSSLLLIALIGIPGFRPPDSPPLSPVRSLAYSLPVIEEILFNPVPDDYLGYLRKKVQRLGGEKTIKRR